MLIISMLSVLLIGTLLYTRYFPVKGVPCVDQKTLSHKKVKLDVREYNLAAKEGIANSISLPVAYLKRHHEQIPTDQIYLIASDKVEKNIGIRILKQRGHQVAGYTIINAKCRCRKRLIHFALKT